MPKSERTQGLIIVAVIVTLLLIPLIVIATNGKKNMNSAPDSDSSYSTKPTLDVDTIEVDRLATERTKVTVDTLKPGVGEEVAEAGDTISVHYVGVLTDGTEFDSSYNYGQPYTFMLGTGRVIKGWDQGLLGAKEGESRLLLIPSGLGYGASGSGPIPPDADLVFHTVVTDIQKAN